MARRGDGIYLRGKTWWLDFLHEGGATGAAREGDQPHGGGRARQREARRHPEGRGGHRRPEAEGHRLRRRRPRSSSSGRAPNKRRRRSKRTAVRDQLAASFAGKRLSELHPFLVEKHKRGRVEAGAPVSRNRELTVLRAALQSLHGLGAGTRARTPSRTVKRVKESEGPAPLPRARRGGRAARGAARAAPHHRAGRAPRRAAGRVRGPDAAGPTSTFGASLLTVQAAYAKTARRGRCRSTACSARPWRGSRSGARAEGVSRKARMGAVPLHPHRLLTACAAREARGRDAARAAPHVRLPAGDGRRRPADDSGAGRVARAQDGRAVRASEPEPQGRSGRAACPEFPNAIHDSASSD